MNHDVGQPQLAHRGKIILSKLGSSRAGAHALYLPGDLEPSPVSE